MRLLSCLVLIATSLAVVNAQPSHAAADLTLCPSVAWTGASAAGADRAYKVKAPPGPYQSGPDWSPEGTTSCYVKTMTVDARSTQPFHLVAGYQLRDRASDGGTKSLAYTMIMCFDSAGATVFRQSVAQNLWNGGGQYGYYPRALFYPPAVGLYDCGVRVSNAHMGPPDNLPVNVYVIEPRRPPSPHAKDWYPSWPRRPCWPIIGEQQAWKAQ